MEVYKVIVENPDYEISNLGNCKNSKTGRILKPLQMKNGYEQYNLSRTNEDNKRVQCHKYRHRLIGIYHINNPNNYTDIDHIDRNPTNNDIDNLRWVSKSLNLMNQKKALNKSSIYKGVHYDKSRDKWSSNIEINKIVSHLGRFETEIEAYEARKKFISEKGLESFFQI